MPKYLDDKERKKKLLAFQKRCNIRFVNLNLLDRAFYHRSFIHEKKYNFNNERFEFLGDSVLGMVISDYLFLTYPDYKEGNLATLKSYVVSEKSLAEIAVTLDIGVLIQMGKGEDRSGGRDKPSLLSDCLEAIIGAYYIDSGFKAVRKFIIQQFKGKIFDAEQKGHYSDYKSKLQQSIQKTFKCSPKYSLLEKSGPEHDVTFKVAVEVNGKRYPSGTGKSKKEAEQEAAESAYKIIFCNS